MNVQKNKHVDMYIMARQLGVGCRKLWLMCRKAFKI